MYNAHSENASLADRANTLKNYRKGAGLVDDSSS